MFSYLISVLLHSLLLFCVLDYLLPILPFKTTSVEVATRIPRVLSPGHTESCRGEQITVGSTLFTRLIGRRTPRICGRPLVQQPSALLRVTIFPSLIKVVLLLLVTAAENCGITFKITFSGFEKAALIPQNSAWHFFKEGDLFFALDEINFSGAF